MNSDLPVSTFERQQAIHAIIEKNRRISLTSICESFSISEATARRDLESLELEGKIQRVRGGAIYVEKSPPELPILEREDEQSDLKDRIGKAAAQLIQPGDTIFLGSGTTVLAIARHLYKCKNITVLTNSLPIINLLIGCTGINLVVFGGMLRDSELSFIGHITENALKEVRADKIFMGARAIDLNEGITNDYLAETLTDRAIIKVGQKVFLAADYSKFGTVSTAFLAPLEDVDVIVTNKEIDSDYVNALEEKGLKVILS